MQLNERKASRTRSPSGRLSRWPCKDYLKGTCNNSFCERWHPPECLFSKTKSGCRFGERCSYAHSQVDEQPTKRSKKNDDKGAVAMLKKGVWHESEHVVNYGHDRSGRPGKKRDNELKRGPAGRRSSNARQLGCVFQDMMKPPKSILRKSSDQSAVPCKIMKNCGSGASKKNKTKLACILEANAPTRMRMEESLPNHHEDHIAGKGENS